MRSRRVVSTVAFLLLAALVTAPGAGAAKRSTYIVLYAKGAKTDSARKAIRRAGGTIVRENRKIGLAYVKASSKRFKTRAGKAAPLAGVARNRSIGRAR